VDSTSLHVLSIDVVVVGDVLFNQFRNRGGLV
jgi:hypothetical protein